MGKAAVDWQEFIREAGREAHVWGDEYPDPGRTSRKRGPDHSSAGAIHAGSVLGPFSLPIQFAIAGHHAGLANKQDLASSPWQNAPDV
jgi:CRISPR-associated endonuclease/helicase Cas3